MAKRLYEYTITNSTMNGVTLRLQSVWLLPHCLKWMNQGDQGKGRMYLGRVWMCEGGSWSASPPRIPDGRGDSREDETLRQHTGFASRREATTFLLGIHYGGQGR